MDQDLRIYAKGDAFSNGVYDLRALENLISNYRKILDGLVAVQIGKRQVTPDLKNQLNYAVQINSGSIELLVNFALEHKEFIAAFAADGGQALSSVVVSLLRDAVTLREKASELIEKGITVNINISNSFNALSKVNNSNVHSSENGVITINDPKILWAAQLTRAPVNHLLNQMNGTQVEYISISSETEEFVLNQNQKNITGKQKQELPTTLNIIGRLDMVAFSSHRGSIISDNERFSVTWDEQIRQKMQKIADIEGVVFKVRPLVDHKRLDSETIGFHVIDCGNPQQSLGV